jgi:hypothetical protein
MVGLLTVNSSTIGQDGLTLSPQAKTTSNSEIPVDHLQVTLRPLTKDELEAELRSWLDVLRAKITEVGGTELQLKALTEGESSDTLTEQLVALRTAETALVERTRIVLDALKAKGGDVEAAEKFPKNSVASGKHLLRHKSSRGCERKPLLRFGVLNEAFGRVLTHLVSHSRRKRKRS